ncbi:hypothetical protein QBC32DRAFT_349773 [Pseudoneurospora amorphoporcata]|uniref:Uncharacterized protein n=1 Tax=Pseudoneurospora amorphoporcata TaxID=241081 RepID=A0AAN6NQF3_9PEZI|nr:hypothetical protein QBC32DRAFT_349773 [Pseudoneurospora amorphoporcata]
MSTEPVPDPEAHEPNTKKKLVYHANAIEFARNRESQGLAGLIMWLPGDAKGLPRGYLSLNHPVVILSPALSADNTVEIVGMTSFGDKDLTRKFKTRKGKKQRANYLPVEPTPPHPDTPERNVMLKMLPYSPRTPSYVDGSSNSRKTVLFSELREFFHYDCIHEIFPRFYLDTDSYQKLAAFAGFSIVQLVHVPAADPEVEKQPVEQLKDTTIASIEPPSEDDHSQLFGPREPRPYHFIPQPPTPLTPPPPPPVDDDDHSQLFGPREPQPYRFIPQPPTPPTPPTPVPPPPGDDDVPPEPPVYLTPKQERLIMVLEEVAMRSRLHDMLSSQASDLTPEQELIVEGLKRQFRLHSLHVLSSQASDYITPEQKRRMRLLTEELERQSRLHEFLSSRASDHPTPEQERVMEELQRLSRLYNLLPSRASDHPTPEQERIMEELERQSRLHDLLPSGASDYPTPEQERRRRVFMEEWERNLRLNGSTPLSHKSDLDDGRSSPSATQTAGPKTREMASSDLLSRKSDMDDGRSSPSATQTAVPKKTREIVSGDLLSRKSDDGRSSPSATKRAVPKKTREMASGDLLSRKSDLDDGRSSPSATCTQTAGPKKTREMTSSGDYDDAPKQTQNEDSPSNKGLPGWWMGLSRRTRVATILVSGSAVIGGLGWKFYHSRLGGELFAEAVAGRESLKLVGRGLMGLSTAVARGVWAMTKHCIRHPKLYTGIGLVYGLWVKEKLYILGILLALGITFLEWRWRHNKMDFLVLGILVGLRWLGYGL